MATAPGFATCSYELRHTAINRSAFITFGIDPTATDPAAIASSLNGVFAATGSLKAVFDSGVTMLGARVSLGTDGSEDLVGTAAAATLGLRSIDVHPANVAVLVHKRTGRGGRRGRGRFYLPWVVGTNDTTEAGIIQTTLRTTVQTAMDTFLGALSAGPGPMVVLHKPSLPGTEHPTTPGPPSVVTSLALDPLVATQRRRLGR